MSASHVVQDLLFDVEFETQEQAWEHQERLASFLHRTALQIIEEEFDRCSGSDAVLRLDVLSVDLGSLALDELDTLGAQRLREQLWLALQGHCEPRQGSEAYDDEPGQVEGTLWRTPADADLEAFVQFLQSGRWPWYVRFACDPVELAERVWQQRARQLLQRLRGLAESPTALCRVVRQMSPAWLRRLESSLTHRALSELLPWPANSEHAERRLRAALTASTAVTSAIEPDQMALPWPEAQRQDPAALQRLLREVLALYLPLSDVERVLNAWQQAAPVAKSAAELGPMLASLRMLVARADGAEADDSSEVEQEASTDRFRSAVVQRLKAWLVNQADADVLSAEDEAELEALWVDAQRQEPAALRRLLSTLGLAARVRRHMAQHWPRGLLSEVLALYLSPSDVERVLNLWQQVSQIDRSAQDAPAGKSAVEQAAWGIVLRHLWAGDTEGQAVVSPMLVSLRRLAVRADDPAEVEPEADTNESISVAVQRLKAWLASQADADALSAGEETELEALWGDAQRQDPATLQRLLRKVLALHLSPSDVESVRNAWRETIRIDSPAQDTHATKSAAEQAAWHTVLHHLWAGDAEGQAVVSPMLASLRTLVARADDPAEVEQEANADESRSPAVQRLKVWLVKQADADALSAEDEAELGALWADAQRQDPAALRWLLSTLGVSVRVRRHMAQHWPQRLLREVLALYLSPFDVESVLTAWREAAQSDSLAPDAPAGKSAVEQAAWGIVLRHLWAGDTEGQAVVSPMLVPLRRLAVRADDPTEVEPEADAGGLRSAAVQHLKAWLVKQADADALSAEDEAELEALWVDAQRQEPAALRRLLSTLGLAARVRRHMAQHWPRGLLSEVLALYLSPSDVERVLNLWQQVSQIDRSAQDAPAGKSAVEQAAWGIVLRHLWAGDTEGQAVVSPMLVSLRRLAVRADDPAEVEPEADTNESISVAVQRLKAWLASQADADALSAGEETELEALWGDAQRQDPATLQRLLRKVLALHLSPSDVESVRNAWRETIRIDSPAQDTHATKSAAEQAAWHTVLHHLWAGDAEGQAVVSPMLASLRTLVARADDPAEVEQEANADESRSPAVQRLKVWLVKQADADALSAEDEAELGALWADAQRQDPAALRWLLSTLGVSVRVRRHMAQHWPRGLLREVLALYLSPSDVERVLNLWQQVSQIDRSAQDAPAGKSAVEQAAWGIVLRHLWAGDTEGQAVVSPMLVSLRRLAVRADDPAEVEPEADTNESISVAVQRLKAWLASQADADALSAGEETELEALWGDAQRQDPATLQRLLRKVLALHLSPSDVKSVRNAWRETAQIDSSAQDTRATKSAAEQAAWSTVSHHLWAGDAEGQAVVEPILASLRTLAAKADDPAEVEQEANADGSRSAAVQRLKAWLVSQADADAMLTGDTAELEALWAGAQRQDPAALQRLLREVLVLHLSPSDVESVRNAWRETIQIDSPAQDTHATKSAAEQAAWHTVLRHLWAQDAEGQAVANLMLASLRTFAARADGVESGDLAEVEQKADANESRSAAVRRLKAWLVSQADADALSAEDEAELEALWADAQRQDPAALRQLLSTLGASVRVRRHMARHWPQRVLREVLALYLSPVDVESVFNAWQAARIDLLAPDARAAKTAAEQAAWQTVLRHLWAGDAEGQAVVSPMLASLRTLVAKADDPAEVEQEANADGSRSAAVQRLKAWLVKMDTDELSAGEETELEVLWADAQRQDPAALQRVLRKMLALHLPPSDVESVLNAWREAAEGQTVLGPVLASLRALAERDDRVEFDDPAEVEPEVNADGSGSAAVQRQDPAALQRLLREVLALHLSPSDVESVLNAWREAAEGQTVLGPVLASLRALAERGDRVEFDDPAEVEPEANADGSRSAAVQRLKAWLVSQADADAMLTGDAAELEALWADVQRRDSAALRQLLSTLGASVRVRQHMAQRWPQRVLREVLALYLSPSDVERVLNAWQQAARIDPLAPDARGGTKTTAEQAAWHTVLRHLWARDIEGRAVAIPMLASLRTLAAKADDPAEVEQETNANGLGNAVVQAWQPTQSTALVRALRAWWPEAQVEALMRLLGGSWPLSWLRLVSLGSQAELQRLTNQLALLVETATVPPEPGQLVAWLWRECAQRQHRSAAELALALKADRSAAAAAWLKWWPDVQAVLGDESHGDVQATLEPETAGVHHASDRHTFTVALSARLPGEQAEMLADLVFGTLPQGWQEAADGVSGEVAGCVQWCLRTLDNQPNEPPPDVAELVHRWLPVLAWQQGRSPQEWVDDVLIKPTRAADALRQQAWLKGWMEEKRTPDAQPESPSWQCSPNSPHLKHLQQVDLMRLRRNSQALQAWAAALPDGAWPEVWALLLPPTDVPVLMQALQSLNSMAFGDSSQALLALRQQALMALLWLTPADLKTVVGLLIERQAWRADVPLPMWARQLRDQAAVTEGMTSPLAQLWGHWVTEQQVRHEGGEKDEPIEAALHRIVADLRHLESDAMAPTILADWLRLIHHSHADTVQARAILSREMEKTAAAHRLADCLTPGELLAVVAWLRPAEAKDLRAVWPQLRLLALPWPAVARPLLRDRFVEDRPFEVDALLQRMKRAVWRDSPRQGQVPASTATRPQSEPWHFPEPPDLNEPIFVTNAGLVLLGPYLPLLFDRLGLLREQQFIDERAAERAVLLTQFAVTGHAAAPETDLMLNKLLCGVPFEAVLPRAIVMQAHEQEMIETLLTAVIAHWSALGRTSVAGLRETFLQREGRLEHGEDRWQLQVKSLTFDVLMDRLPWGYATLKFPWMREVLHVDWR